MITFDLAGNAVLLTSEANMPIDFIEPIRAWISEGKKFGRHIATSCLSCGRTFFARPNRAREHAIIFFARLPTRTAQLTPTQEICRKVMQRGERQPKRTIQLVGQLNELLGEQVFRY